MYATINFSMFFFSFLTNVFANIDDMQLYKSYIIPLCKSAFSRH